MPLIPDMTGTIRALGATRRVQNAPILVGDATDNAVSRGFVAFNLASIPAASQVVGATLRLAQIGATNFPLRDLGVARMEPIPGSAPLDGSEWGAAALPGGPALVSDSQAAGERVVDVTVWVQAAHREARGALYARLFCDQASDREGVRRHLRL